MFNKLKIDVQPVMVIILFVVVCGVFVFVVDIFSFFLSFFFIFFFLFCICVGFFGGFVLKFKYAILRPHLSGLSTTIN